MRYAVNVVYPHLPQSRGELGRRRAPEGDHPILGGRITPFGNNQVAAPVAELCGDLAFCLLEHDNQVPIEVYQPTRNFIVPSDKRLRMQVEVLLFVAG